MKVSQRKGFTIVEVLIVIAIMAVLSAIIYSSFNQARVESRDKKRFSDISLIKLALEQYFNKVGQYPTTLSALVPAYLPAIPTPPSGGPAQSSYTYTPFTQINPTSPICNTYQLSTTFEAPNAYLASKAGFNSYPLPSGWYICAGLGGTLITASNTPLIYDVMPR